MDWEMFLMGLGMIAAAFLLWRYDLWYYRKKQDQDEWDAMQKLRDNVWSIAFGIGGVIVILVSFGG